MYRSLTGTLDYMSTDAELRRIFNEVKTIAVVGASMHDYKPSHRIPAYLQQQGYRIVPVNPRGGELFGEHVYRSLEELDMPVDAVEVFRPPAEAAEVARRAPATGAKVLWFQPGTHTATAAAIASQAGMTVVVDRCMEPEHRRLGLER
jgi:predicted CoA-binding protein